MTTTVKKNPAKRSRKKDASLPPAADVAVIGGREFVIMPRDEFDEWCDDRMFDMLVAERLETLEGNAIPWNEFEKRLAGKLKRKK